MAAVTLQDVANNLRYYDNFPEEGIRFFDFEAILENPDYWKAVVEDFYNRYKEADINYVVGLDSRGNHIAGALGLLLGCGIRQARKPGKLPGEVVSRSYTMEYGTKTIEMENNNDLVGKRVVIVDDLLATGGSLEAVAALVDELGGIVVECACVTELPELKGRKKLLHHAVYSQISIIDNQAYAGVRYCIDPLITDKYTHDILLIERLSHPIGIAMPGGGIERFESLITALMREVKEETGCLADLKNISFHSVLTGADRDPRGVQVSYVFRVKTDTRNATGEEGKTSIFTIKAGSTCVPSAVQFAFDDHHQTLDAFVRDDWSKDPNVKKAAAA